MTLLREGADLAEAQMVASTQIASDMLLSKVALERFLTRSDGA